MHAGFLAGMGPAIAEPARTEPDRLLTWNARATDVPCFVHARCMEEQVFFWDSLALLLPGYLRPQNRERLAEELRWRYLEEGVLDLSGLEGNATSLLLDAQAGLVLLARPHNSIHAVYYQATDAGLLLGSNLAELAACSGQPQVNRLAAEAWLDLGSFPDQMTLFQGIARLLPGEMVTWSATGLQRDELPRPPVETSPVQERLEEVMRDCAELTSRPVCLFTGSVAGFALQTLRNQLLAVDEMLPATLSLCVDEPQAWDQTDAIVRASLDLGTGHELIQSPTDVVATLRDTLLATGEPSAWPDDLHLSYLATQVRTHGHSTVILDAGGDTWPADPGGCWHRLRQTAWTAGCFEQAGVEAICPLLDSRLFPGCERFDRTRGKLLQALKTLVPRQLRRRQQQVALQKGWLQPRGPLWPLVERLRTHDLISKETLDRARATPTEWLYRLVCYDLWHQLFLEEAGRAIRTPDVAHSKAMPC